jgi:hypothetical protein
VRGLPGYGFFRREMPTNIDLGALSGRRCGFTANLTEGGPLGGAVRPIRAIPIRGMVGRAMVGRSSRDESTADPARRKADPNG